MSILEEIKGNINDYWYDAKRGAAIRDGDKDLYPVFAPSQYNILELIDLYWVSKFLNHNFDEDGQKKPFLQVCKIPVFVAGRMLDVDTKEVRVIPEGLSSPLYAHLFGLELSNWMKTTGFSKFLNNSKWLLPKYGTLVAKRVKTKDGVSVRSVPLKNLRSNTRVDKLENSNVVVEEHEIPMAEFEKRAEERGWDIKKITENEDKKVKLLEAYGDLSDKKNFHIVVDDGDSGTVLEEDNIVDFPYKDIHWDKVSGRYLGIGQVESTFESQIHLNWVQYLKSRGLHWTSKHIYQTEDEGIDRNMLVDVDDGEVFHARRPVEPIPVEERNLHAYQEEESVWLSHTQRASFTQDVLMGAQKSGIPLGSTVIQAQMAGSFFENKKEELADFYKEILNDWIIPSFKNKNSAEHILNLSGSEPDKIRKFVDLEVKERVNKRAARHLSNRGSLPDGSTLELYRSRERAKLNEQPIKEIPKGVYKDLEYKIEVIITGEAADLKGKLQAIQMALQTAQDPQERARLQNRMLQLIDEEPNIEVPEQSSIDTLQQREGSQPRVRIPQGTPGAVQERTNI